MTSTEDPTRPVWEGRGSGPPAVVGASSGLCTSLGGGCAGGQRGAATWSGWGRASCRQQGEGYGAWSAQEDGAPAARSTASAVSLKMLRLRLVRMLMLPLLLLPLGQAAPKDGAARLDSEVQLLTNPFQPGPEQLRLLQNYLKGLERIEEEPEHMNREQVLLYLFALHDYDQSGQLDGLELLSMLTAALAPGAANFPINPVILVVDKVLETQDLDGDGFMTPAELINFPGEAPSHAEPLTPVLQEPQSAGSQLPLAKSPSRPETQQALEPGEEARGQVEARSESLEPVQEAEHQTGTEGDTLSLGGESRGQVEAEDVPSPREDAGGQVEGRADEGETKELPGEALETMNTPNEIEAHSVQLENYEI